MHLYSLIYVSRSLIGGDTAILKSIAEVAQRNNARVGVTGFLYHDDDTFLQVIEGADEDLRWLFDRISSDERHEQIRMLGFYPIETRAFGGWSMGLYDGALEGGLLSREFGPEGLHAATGTDVTEIMRFLRNLSLGRDDIYRLPSRASA